MPEGRVTPLFATLILRFVGRRTVFTVVPCGERRSLPLLMKGTQCGQDFIVDEIGRPAIGGGDRYVELAVHRLEPRCPAPVAVKAGRRPPPEAREATLTATSTAPPWGRSGSASCRNGLQSGLLQQPASTPNHSHSANSKRFQIFRIACRSTWGRVLRAKARSRRLLRSFGQRPCPARCAR
jgi:hypothetical protein